VSPRYRRRVASRLVLWDIDGTLVRAGESGALVFDLALERAVGARPVQRVLMSGKTDPQIAREYLALMELEADDHLPQVLKHLEDELAAAAEIIRRDGSACPGAEEALRALSSVSGVHQSVLTGNLAPNAVVKLSAFGLEHYLDLECGAYGSDEEDRRLLVPIALARQSELRGRTFRAEETWIVGDSPRDLECARAGGAHCLLVGTGRFAVDELASLGADAVFADLRDTAALVALIAGATGGPV
jgi:phosphoglycolate phosphatase